jgi:hypothetical protein
MQLLLRQKAQGPRAIQTRKAKEEEEEEEEAVNSKRHATRVSTNRAHTEGYQ